VLSDFTVFCHKNITWGWSTQGRANPASRVNCIDALNLGYWFLLYEKIPHRYFLKRLFSQDNANLMKERSASEFFFGFAGRFFNRVFFPMKSYFRRDGFTNRIKSVGRKTLANRGISLYHRGLNASPQYLR